MAIMKPSPNNVHSHPKRLLSKSKHSTIITGPLNRMPMKSNRRCTLNASTLNSVTILPVSYSARAVGDNLRAFSYNARDTAEYIWLPKCTMHVSYRERQRDPSVGAKYSAATQNHCARMLRRWPPSSKCFTSIPKMMAGTSCNTPSTR